MPPTSSTLLDPAFLKKLEALSLVSKRVFAGQTKGERRSLKRGSSVEFADFREYALGDDLRYVDWKAYGRLEKLFLKLFVEEEDLSIHLLIDTSESMNFGSPLTKADYARRVAAALGYVALSEYDRVLLASFSGKLGERMPPLRGKPGVFPFFQFLETKLSIGGETRFGDALTQYAAQAKNVGIAIILSDFFDDTHVQGIRALLSRRYQVVLLHILDEEELHPTLTGDLRLVDSETGAVREVSISPHLLAQYDAQVQSFCTGLQQLAGRYNLEYVRTSTALPFEDVVLKSLRGRGLLR
jgi:uncharacterized protein (DUF58 family)